MTSNAPKFIDEIEHFCVMYGLTQKEFSRGAHISRANFTLWKESRPSEKSFKKARLFMLKIVGRFRKGLL